MWGADVTLTFSEQGYTNAQQVSSGTIDSYTSWSATNGGTNKPTYYDTGTGLRVYNGGTFSITSTKTIASITLTFSGTGYTFSTSNTTTPQTVTPNATSYSWDVSRTCRLQKIEVTYAIATKYAITVNVSSLGDTGNGFKVNNTYYSSYQYLANAVAAGETVTLEASPKSGYKATADCWNVLLGTTPVSVAGSGNNYSFTMPAGNVSISPVFVAESTPSAPTKLATPTNLSATNVTATSATLSWNAVTNASSYELTVLDDQAEYVKNAQSVSGTSYEVTGLHASTTYTWTVKAIGDGVSYSDGEESDEVDFTTLAQGGGEEPGGDNPSGEEATMAAGTNGSAAKVNDKDAIKVGTSKAGGDMTITVPAGATKLEFYAAAWNGADNASISITPEANVNTTSVSLTANSGISGNSPFTLSGTESTYKHTISLRDVNAETAFTLSASSRFVVWGATYATSGGDEPTEKTTPTLSFAPATATAYLDALSMFVAPVLTTDPENLTGVSYRMSGDPVGTINTSTGALTLTAAGTATITASYAGDGVKYYAAEDASYTLTVNAKAPEKTIAEFIASKGGCCYLTGTVSNITNTTYGNFDLTDETGTIFIYGCLTSEGKEKMFESLGVVAGDKIKVLANEYDVYHESAEAKNVIFVEEIEIEKPKYTVTIETPENGTLVVKEGENTLTSGDKVEEGKTLTIECTPTDAETYRYKNWQYKEDGNWVTMKSTMSRVITQDISIRANFELIPVYTVAFSVNGAIVQTNDLKEGAAVTAYADPEDINGKVFTGWIETATVVGETPAYVTPSATAEKTVTYYAVFADGEGGGAETWNKVTDASTLAENDVIAIVSSEAVDYNIKGNTTKYNGYIAMGKTQNNNNRAGVVVTVTDDVLTINDDVQQITLTKATFGENTDWQLGVDGGYLYANNSSSNYLKTQETNDVNGLWNISITDGKATIYAKYSSYTRNYIRVNGNYANGTTNAPLVTAYKSDATTGVLATIYKKTGGAEYSNFTTLPDAVVLKVSAAGYATYFNEKAYVMPAGLEGKVMKVRGNGVASETAFAAGAVVPAETALVLKGEEGDYTLAGATSAGTEVKDNLLKGSTTALEASSVTTTFGEGKYYKLVNEDNGIGWYWGAEAGAAFAFKANKAYLVVPAAQASNIRYISIDGDGGVITGIDAIDAATEDAEIYNLQGQRVNRAQKGVYVVNGRKVIR